MRISMSPPHYYKKCSVYAFSHFPARSLYTLSFRTLINTKRASLGSRRPDSYSVLFIVNRVGLNRVVILFKNRLLHCYAIVKRWLVQQFNTNMATNFFSVYVNTFLTQPFVHGKKTCRSYWTALNAESLPFKIISSRSKH